MNHIQIVKIVQKKYVLNVGRVIVEIMVGVGSHIYHIVKSVQFINLISIDLMM